MTDQPGAPTVPPSEPEAPSPRDEASEPQSHVEAVAQNLRDKTGGGYLYATMGHVHKRLPPTAYLPYMDGVVHAAGDPQDPIEKMMVEQITLAHHNVARLLIAAASAETIDQAKVYNDAGTKLLGEFRRLSLALKEYREPTPARQYTLVKQQNIAAQQQVAMLEGRGEQQQHPESDGATVGKIEPNSEKGSTHVLEYQPIEQLVPESTPGRSREKEPVEAARSNARRPRSLATGRAEEPPMGAGDGPEDPGREGPLGSEWQEATETGDIRA